MKSSTTKWLLGTGALIALGVLGGSTYYRNSHKADYMTVRVDRGDIESTISATGNCNAVVTVQVGSQVSGNILKLYANFNTKVKKGQLVAQIDPALFQAKVDQARANLDSAKAAVVNARAMQKKTEADVANAVANVANQKANLVRAQSAVADAKTKYERRVSMVKDKIISQEDLDTAKATYDQAVASLDAVQAQLTAAQSSVESAQAEHEVSQTQLASAEAMVKQNTAALEQADVDLEHTRILAPVDGTVVSRNMDVGQTVAASFSAPTIFLIAQDLTKMQVDTNVDEADIGEVQVGQKASFTVDAFPGTPFEAEVSQIRKAPTNVQNVITYDVVLTVGNKELKLLPGMTANVRILSNTLTNVLKVPNAAFRFKPAGADLESSRRQSSTQTLYILGPDNVPRPAPVTAGLSDGSFTAISGGGVQEGNLVIVGYAKSGSEAGHTAVPRGPAF